MQKAIQIAFDDRFESLCAYAAEAGFRAISVNFNDMPDRSKDVFAAASERILRTLEKNGLSCVQSHLPYYDLTLSAEITDEAMETAILSSLRVAGEVGIPWNVYHPRSAVSQGFSITKSREENIKRVSGYLEAALKYHTGIALENLPIFSGWLPIKPFYPYTYLDLCELVDSFHSNQIGLCWDTGHANLMDLDQAKAIHCMGNRLKVTHIHNNPKSGDFHAPPDQGDIDWASLMTAIREIGYDGPLTLETHCHYHDEGLLKAFARYNLECLRFLERLTES